MARFAVPAVLLLALSCGGDTADEDDIHLSFVSFPVRASFLSEVRDGQTSSRRSVTLHAASRAAACGEIATKRRPAPGSIDLTVHLGPAESGGEGWEQATSCAIGDGPGPCVAGVLIQEATDQLVRFWSVTEGTVTVVSRTADRLEIELDATFLRESWFICDAVEGAPPTPCESHPPDALDLSGPTERLRITLAGARSDCPAACQCSFEGSTCGCE